MKKFMTLIVVASFIHTSYCQKHVNKESLKKEIYRTEKAFKKLVSSKGVAEAFYIYADENAVILRENDSIIKGKENIKQFYDKKPKNAVIEWTPDFIDVSNDGTMGYTYGKYVWKITKEDGSVTELKGVFHTVWKKQTDGSWKYVWN